MEETSHKFLKGKYTLEELLFKNRSRLYLYSQYHYFLNFSSTRPL